MESLDIRQLYLLADKVKADPNHGSSVASNNLQGDSDAEQPPPVEDVVLDESTASIGGAGNIGCDDDIINSNKSTQKQLVNKETVTVSRLRVIVLVLLVVLMVAIPVALYAAFRQAETDEFQAHYDAAAEQLIES